MNPYWLERLGDYAKLMRLHRPIGIFLLLWPVLWALWLASAGQPSLPVLIVFVAGVVLMRSAGCVINDYADREIDPHVERTRDRPLATGRIQPRAALILFLMLSLTSFVLVLSMNRLTILLSFIGAALAVSYPFMKRWTHLPQFYLGAAFGWGVPMAYAAQTGRVPFEAWLLFAATLCWAVAYDTLYAMVDRDDDLRVGVKSTAILFGRYDRVMVAVFHGLSLLFLAWAGARTGLGLVYYMGLLFAAGFAARQQWWLREPTRDNSFRAFLNNNRFGAVIFAGMVVDLFK